MRHSLNILMIAALIFGLSACSTESSAPQDVGQTTSRIVGGSSYDGLPAVGSLLYNGSQHCTGTLIGPKTVLTAAHCVDGFSASRMTFVTGPNVSSPDSSTQVASMTGHPNYNAYSITNDIAYVTLASQPPVEPMPVLTYMDSSFQGTELFFVGYGANNGYNQTGYGVKRAVWMAISRVDATTFRYDDPNRNTCNGDSGGPAFFRGSDGTYYVAGVTSYGDQYCASYGVDTRVDAFLDFLPVAASQPDPQPDPEPVDPCDGETWEGRCAGETVVWCENEKVYQQDCASDGKVCGYDAGRGYYVCQVPVVEEPSDPCEGETYAGRCQGDTVVWCENEEVMTQDCAATDMVCVYDGDKGYFACREPEIVDPCNGETFDGRCEDGSVIWCENEEIKSINCTAAGYNCGYSSSKGYYDCMN